MTDPYTHEGNPYKGRITFTSGSMRTTRLVTTAEELAKMSTKRLENIYATTNGIYYYSTRETILGWLTSRIDRLMHAVPEMVIVDDKWVVGWSEWTTGKRGYFVYEKGKAGPDNPRFDTLTEGLNYLETEILQTKIDNPHE